MLSVEENTVSYKLCFYCINEKSFVGDFVCVLGKWYPKKKRVSERQRVYV